MALWALAPPQQVMVDINWSTSTITAETQTAHATPHTKGAWNEWVAATSTTWSGMSLVVSADSYLAATDSSMLLDIGVGSAGNEVVILGNLPVGYSTALRGALTIPLRVPEGARVAARIQAAQSSDTVIMKLAPHAGGGFTGSGCYQSAVTYGANIATSRGVTVTADTGTNDSFGSWTEIAASTSAPIRAMIVGAQGAGDTDVSTTGYRLELGYGAAGTEQVIAATAASYNSAEILLNGVTPLVPTLVLPTVGIPEGARLAARLMTGASTTTTATMDVVIIGLR
jgi:hypothetical protein